MPSLLWQLQHSDDDDDEDPASSTKQLPKIDEEDDEEQQMQRSDGEISSLDRLPGLDSAYERFVGSHPKFGLGAQIDESRESDYPHLRSSGCACFDYCGIGLFTTPPPPRSADFGLTTAHSASLAAHAAYSGAGMGADLESELRRRVMSFLNVADGYSLIFAASKRAAFGLVAGAYDFAARPRLLTVYDHESESVRSLVAAARAVRARATAATFAWPGLSIRGDELASEIKRRRRRRGGPERRKGLFVFPTQSRITGARYSYQWMSMAEKHHWDVLLDVSAMGPKDMASLGLSMFRPDFIVCSFYRSFGADPTGFGCLLVKNSSLASFRSGTPSAGIVRVVPVLSPPRTGDRDEEDEGPSGPGKRIIAFSGPVLSPASSGMGFQPCSSEIGHWDDEDEESSRGKSPLANGQHHGSETSSSFAGQSEIEEEPEHGLGLGLDPRNGTHAPSFSSSSSAPAGPPAVAAASSSSSATLEDDSVFRRISRDEGLIDSRRSDMFRRFLPIREDIEEESDQQMHASIAETGKRNSSSWDAEGDYYYDDEVLGSDEDWAEYEDDDMEVRQPPRPLIVCTGLDHVSSLGLNMTNSRIKSLMDWLITSMSRLVHRNSASASGKPVVQIYGPRSQPDRGPAVAFNIFDHRGVIVQPSTVQKVADRHGIALGTGVLSSIFIEDEEGGNTSDGDGNGNGDGKQRPRRSRKMPEKCSSFMDPHAGASGSAGLRRMKNTPVVTATLGLVTNFEDVYRLWDFAAKFLDLDFLTGELLYYRSINQETVVVGSS